MGVQNILPLVVLSNETKNFKIHGELTELLTETLVPTRTRTTTSDTYRVLPQWRAGTPFQIWLGGGSCPKDIKFPECLIKNDKVRRRQKFSRYSLENCILTL